MYNIIVSSKNHDRTKKQKKTKKNIGYINQIVNLPQKKQKNAKKKKTLPERKEENVSRTISPPIFYMTYEEFSSLKVFSSHPPTLIHIHPHLPTEHKPPPKKPPFFVLCESDQTSTKMCPPSGGGAVHGLTPLPAVDTRWDSGAWVSGWATWQVGRTPKHTAGSAPPKHHQHTSTPPKPHTRSHSHSRRNHSHNLPPFGTSTHSANPPWRSTPLAEHWDRAVASRVSPPTARLLPRPRPRERGSSRPGPERSGDAKRCGVASPWATWGTQRNIAAP